MASSKLFKTQNAITTSLMTGYIDFVIETLKPAIPNFSWSHATTGEKDDQGYSIVRVQVNSISLAKAIMPNSIGFTASCISSFLPTHSPRYTDF